MSLLTSLRWWWRWSWSTGNTAGCLPGEGDTGCFVDTGNHSSFLDMAEAMSLTSQPVPREVPPEATLGMGQLSVVAVRVILLSEC